MGHTLPGSPDRWFLPGAAGLLCCTSGNRKMMNSKKKQLKKLGSWLLAALFLAAGVFPAQAAGPGQFSALDDATYARLIDNNLEWDEIGNLVRFYNPTYRKYADSVDATNNELSQANDSFRDEMQENVDTIDESLKTLKEQIEKLSALPGSTIIDERGTTAAQALMQLKMMESSLKSTRAQIRKGMGASATSVMSTKIKTDEQMEPVRDQITKTIEGLVVSYRQLLINRSLVEKQVALYEEIAAMQTKLKDQQLSTEAQVNAAKASVSEAKATLKTVDNGISQLQSAIGLQLGWGADNPPVIGDVPQPDLAYLAQMNPEEDRKKALDESQSFETAGKVETYSAGGGSAVAVRDAALNEETARFNAKFDELYANVTQQKLLYDAANTAMQRAALARDQAKRKMDLGMLTVVEYQAAQLEALSSEATAKLASLSLFNAINEYKWAVRGYMDY